MSKEKLSLTACNRCNDPIKVGNTYYEVEVDKKRIIVCERCLDAIRQEQAGLFGKEK